MWFIECLAIRQINTEGNTRKDKGSKTNNGRPTLVKR